MTLEEYKKLKEKINYYNAKIAYNFGKIDSRWYDRKVNNEDVTHNKDLTNLKKIYNAYIELQKIVKEYIE